MAAILNDTIEALLEDLDTESVALQPKPRRPLQNALPESRPALSVIVAATSCSRELLRTLELLAEAGEELSRTLGRKAEIIVAAYGSESTDSIGAGDSTLAAGAALVATSTSIKGSDRITRSASLTYFASAEEFDAKIVSRNLPNCAAAINAAASVARGKILVLLRPNLMPKKGSLCRILQATANRKSLGGGTNVASEDGSLSSRLAAMISRLPLRLNGVSLGVMFVRKSAFRRLGGFRETMFSGEAIEFALRLKKHAVSTGRQFSNIKTVCATRYGKEAFGLSLKEWLMLFVSPLA
ncbi:MAG: hypothetical protein NTX17_08785 [Candidatus Eisenbacteria bacterium]|nr:hypothetical protein [Candidatus Eisenbacteria bacterium]